MTPADEFKPLTVGDLGVDPALMNTHIVPQVTPAIDAHEQTLDYVRSDEHGTELDQLKQVGPYVVAGELGRGGMGVVYKARHKQLFREVALKMILKAAGDDRQTLSRFQIEAQAVAALKHPGIVQIYEYGEARGIPWFALEFVDGPTLSQIAKDPLQPRRAAKIVADLASAVAYAHQQGVLHRDIKPGNVLIAAGDIPKLTDFGLAKHVANEDSDSNHHTIDGQVMGTPSYMPPEQARGATNIVGPLSDQYSLGATLYHLLGGRAPFVGARPIEVLCQVIERDPVSVRQLQPDTPIDLGTICAKAMAKEPARRYSDCTALEDDLRRFLRNEPILARPIGGLERTFRWCRRNPKTAIPIAAAVISTFVALGISVWSSVVLAKKNRDIEFEKDRAVQAKNLADENKIQAQINAQQAIINGEAAKKHAAEAEENAKTAYQRAIHAKNSMVEMLSAIHTNIAPEDARLNQIRQNLLRKAMEELESLPDDPRDIVLATGFQKARLYEEMFRAALDLGEPSKAVQPLRNAVRIMRERNQAQHTDATRINLAKALSIEGEVRATVERDMRKVLEDEADVLSLLCDILDHPNPQEFNSDHGSVPRIDTLTALLEQGYRNTLYLMKLGRITQAYNHLDHSLQRFDEVLIILRDNYFKDLTHVQWSEQSALIRRKLSDQDLLHSVLMCAMGKNKEATDEQSRVLAQLRNSVNVNPNDFEAHWKLTYGLMFSGDLAKRQSRFDEAINCYKDCYEIARQFYSMQGFREDRRNHYHVSLMRFAGLLRSNDLPQARNLYSQARKIAEEMVKVDDQVPMKDQAITKYVALALVLPFSGPPGEAVNLAEKILQTCPHEDAEINVDMARVYAASAEAEVLEAAPNVESIQKWKHRAMTLLRAAYDQGYRDGSYLSGEPDFSSLRSDEEFTKLITNCNDEFKSQ